MKRRTRNRNVACSNPGRNGGTFFSWCPFHPRVTAVARKRPRSFYQKCRWQVTPKQACTLDPTKSEWADYAALQAECGNLSKNELTRNFSRNIRSQSSQLAEPRCTDPGIYKKWNYCARANLHFKKEKKSASGNEWSNILPKSSQARKKPPFQFKTGSVSRRT